MYFTQYSYRPASVEPAHKQQQQIASWVIQQLPTAFRYEHCGSTAIGVPGKGIIDIACLYPNVKSDVAAKQRAVESIIPQLQALGCEWQLAKSMFPAYRPRLDIGVMIESTDRLNPSLGNVINVHIHLLEYHSIEHQKQRYFRQRLLCSKALRNQYMRIKADLVEQGITEHQAYGQAKSEFIKTILQELYQR